MAHENRGSPIQAMSDTLVKTSVAGIETNLKYLQNIIDCEVFKAGIQTTRFLNTFQWKTQKVEVLQSGIQMSIQDVNGHLGYWDVGVSTLQCGRPLMLKKGKSLMLKKGKSLKQVKSPQVVAVILVLKVGSMYLPT